MGLLISLVIGYEESSIWFDCFFHNLVTRHTGVGTLAAHRL